MQNSCSTYYPVLCHPYCTIVLSQLSSLTIIYFILGVKSCSPTLLVAMYDNFIPPSHHSILCILHFSPFLAKLVILEICLVCLVSLPFLSIHTADLPSNLTRGASSANIYGFLFKNLLINILKCDKAIPAVHDALEFLKLIDQLVL